MSSGPCPTQRAPDGCIVAVDDGATQRLDDTGSLRPRSTTLQDGAALEKFDDMSYARVALILSR